jgi:cellulose synthase/poly-beta-1,6-N-acetylglucosamine synthase-like glycosyltransferase
VTSSAGAAPYDPEVPASPSTTWLRPITILTTFARAGLATATAYLGVLTVGAARRRPRGVTALPDRPTHRLAVLIPAHDEERVIGRTLDSLRRLDYPADLLAVHVVADNCTDATAAIVRAAGFSVHERTAPESPGKGPALQWLLARIADDPVDAVVFVDADTSVHPDALRRIDVELARGAEVVQGHYAVRDAGSSPTVAFRAAAFAARTYLRPLGRVAIGGSAGLHGNGMAFRSEVLAQRRWSDHLTEDVELHLDLLLDGTLVAFAPEATVEAEMPDTLEASQSQHERWERGRLDLVRRYAPRLLRGVTSGGPAGRVAYADALLDQLVPPFSVVVTGSGLWGATALLRAVVHPTRARRRELALALTVGLAQVAYVLIALAMVRAPASVYRSLLQAPSMVWWKLRLWARVLTGPAESRWVRTSRN